MPKNEFSKKTFLFRRILIQEHEDKIRISKNIRSIVWHFTCVWCFSFFHFLIFYAKLKFCATWVMMTFEQEISAINGCAWCFMLHVKTVDGRKMERNKVGYMAAPVACGWAGAVFEVTRRFWQEQWGQRLQKHRKSENVKCHRLTNRPTLGQRDTHVSKKDQGRIHSQ